jgi:hypothetical protein
MIEARASVYASTTHCRPGQRAADLVLDGRQRHVHDRDVELDHEKAQADGDEGGGRAAAALPRRTGDRRLRQGAEVSVHAF